MSKVIFEFDDNENIDDINFIVNRHKIMSSLYDLQKLSHNLYKSYIPENMKCVIEEGKITHKNSLKEDVTEIMPIKLVTEHDIEKARIDGKLFIDNTSTYIKISYIENEINDILSDINHLLD